MERRKGGKRTERRKDGRKEGPLCLLKEKSSQEERKGCSGVSAGEGPAEATAPPGSLAPLHPGAPRIPALEVPYLTQPQHQGIAELSVTFAARKVFVGAKL